MAERKQSGLAHDLAEWVPETEVGVTPADPDFQPFSDNVRTVWDGEPDASTEAQRGLGSRDPRGFFTGPEEHEFTFVYDLQQWYVDGTGATQDPAGDIMQDTADNDVNATHTVVTREVHVDGGPDGAGRYIVTVGKGGYPAELTVPFETEDGLPIQQELTYRFEKVREYSIGQPSAATELYAVSSSADDDTQEVTFENDDGSVTETITLTGDTPASTTETFGSIASVELSDETLGDVEFGTYDATNAVADTPLGEILGKNSHGEEGDLGVPAVGAGSHAGTVGTDYIRFREDVLEYSDGTEIAPEIISGEVTIDNGVEATGKAHTTRQSIDVGQRETTLTASLAGPKPTVDQMVRFFEENDQTVTWYPNESSVGHAGAELQFTNAQLVTPGSIARETDQAKLLVESEWQSEGVNVV